MRALKNTSSRATAEVPFDNRLREAWIKEMIEEQKSRKRGESAVDKDKKEQSAACSGDRQLP